jgi:hypothetical protein
VRDVRFGAIFCSRSLFQQIAIWAANAGDIDSISVCWTILPSNCRTNTQLGFTKQSTVQP